MCYLGFNCFMYMNENLCLKFMEYIYIEREKVSKYYEKRVSEVVRSRWFVYYLIMLCGR